MKSTNIIFDFDATFINCETFDELARIALSGRDDADEIQQEISDITSLGMNGEISFRESLNRRLALVRLHRDMVQEVIKQLTPRISPSILANKAFLKENADRIYIISNGYKEVIEPIAAQCSIHPDHVFAGVFIYDEDGYVTGVEESILLKEGGKGLQLKELDLGPDTIVIGDGYTDYLMKEVGGAKAFIAYTAHTHREKVINAADHVVKTFDEILTTLK